METPILTEASDCSAGSVVQPMELAGMVAVMVAVVLVVATEVQLKTVKPNKEAMISMKNIPGDLRS